MDNLSLQKYLLATRLLRDSIQDSLDMIVTDGNFNNATVRRVLDTKYPSVMKRSNPIDVVFKDQAKFETKSPIIRTLLTQIESGKIKNEKAIENQLKKAPSVKDLIIAEWLEQLGESNSKNSNDDDDSPPPPSFVPPPYYPPPPSRSIDDHNDDDIKKDLNPTQKFLLGEKIVAAVGEKAAAVVKKVRFSENLNKLFPKADKAFNGQKIDIDDDDLLKEEIAIPNTQTIFKELNDGKLPEELKFFLKGSNGGNELKIHTMQNIGMLNECNEHFLDYLTSHFAKEVLAKNEMKIHLDMGNIYYNNLNTREFYACLTR